MRKRRNDRNHALYELEFPDGLTYIGLTVVSGRAVNRAVKVRIQKHMSRAIRENKEWKLYQYMREANVDAIVYRVLEVVRGRKNAHQRERELIGLYQPALNTF
jgi:hypothetical protein